MVSVVFALQKWSSTLSFSNIKNFFESFNKQKKRVIIPLYFIIKLKNRKYD